MYISTILLALPLVSSVAASRHNWHHHRRNAHVRRDVSTGQTTPGEHQHTGAISNCKRWHTAVSGDGCYSIYTAYGITAAQFEAWNPDLEPGEACTVWLNYSYCVGIDDGAPVTTTTTQAAPPTTTFGPPTPLISPGELVPNDQVLECNEWHLVRPGDTCTTVETFFDISHDDFLEWNPTLALDPACVLWSGYWYCIGTGPLQYDPEDQTTTTTTEEDTSTINPGPTTIPSNSSYTVRNPYSSTTLTTTPIENAWPPTKTQAGQPLNCNKWHLVRARDTCKHIASRYGIDEDDLHELNPALGVDCDGLLYQYWVCVGTQNAPSTFQFGNFTGTDFWEPSTTEYIPWTMTNITVGPSTTWIPTPTLSGMDPACTGFHNATEEDTCESIVEQYRAWLTPQLFASWNPGVLPDCSGLVPANFYCVASGGADDIITPPYVTELPSEAPVQSGIAANCVKWYQAVGFDTCEEIAGFFGTIDEEDFINMNPAVEEDCSGLATETWYCVARPDTPTTRTRTYTPTFTPAPTDGPTTTTAETTTTDTPTAVPTPSPVQDNIPAGCVRWHQIEMGDDCWVIASANGISVNTLFSLNPSTNQCVDLWTGYWICTGQAQHVNNFPTPNQGDLNAQCTRFYKIQSGDDCGTIANGAGVSLSNIYSWNPNTNDCVDLWANHFICIGTGSPGTTITTGPALPPVTEEPTTTTTAAIQTPTPTQAGMVSGCVRFYKGITGYGCDEVALAMGITEAEFKLLNPALGEDCAGLWLDYYYCVGITGTPHTQTVWPN